MKDGAIVFPWLTFETGRLRGLPGSRQMYRQAHNPPSSGGPYYMKIKIK